MKKKITEKIVSILWPAAMYSLNRVSILLSARSKPARTGWKVILLGNNARRSVHYIWDNWTTGLPGETVSIKEFHKSTKQLQFIYGSRCH